ncbi:MAG: 2-isopropylmalate synthase [Bacillota bacterium]
MTEKIYIFDTTLRDGEQMPGVNLNLHEKLEIARQLEELGVDCIEGGFPAASPGDFEAVKTICDHVQCSVAALCRAVPGDIHRGWEALKDAKKPRIHTFIATSPVHMEYKLRMQPPDVVKRAYEAVALARSLCGDVEFSPEDATRSNPEFLYEVLEAVIKAGATTLNIPDTVGYTTPEEFAALITGIRQNVPGIEKAVISVHCHNDLGLAVANSLSGVKSGARQVECTINGLGERAGNAALEEIIMGLATRPNYYNIGHNIKTERIYRTSRMVSSITGVDVQINKAIVGANAFKHEAGIHQHGVLANASTYEIMTPESVGITVSGIVLGKHSGRHAFVEKLKELGYNFTSEEIDEAFIKFKNLADRKKDVTDRDIEALVGSELAEVPEIYELVSFQIQSGNTIRPIGSVTLNYKGEQISEAAVGDGPIDACFRAIDRCIGADMNLESYVIRAVTEGKDALGEVTTRVSFNGSTYTGKGISTDIIESSVRSYLNAANRALSDYELQTANTGK